MMKNIFLDIDGVVATDATYAAWRLAGRSETFDGYVSLFDPEKVGLINTLSHRADAGIVVSSNWRLPRICPHPIVDVLRAAGFAAPIIGQTPELPPMSKYDQFGHRGREIAEYVRINGILRGDFVILDDDRAARVGHGYAFVQTSDRWGVAPRHIELALKILEIK